RGPDREHHAVQRSDAGAPRGHQRRAHGARRHRGGGANQGPGGARRPGHAAGVDALLRPAVPAVRQLLRPVPAAPPADAPRAQPRRRRDGPLMTVAARVTIVGGVWTLLHLYVGSHLIGGGGAAASPELRLLGWAGVLLLAWLPLASLITARRGTG